MPRQLQDMRPSRLLNVDPIVFNTLRGERDGFHWHCYTCLLAPFDEASHPERCLHGILRYYHLGLGPFLFTNVPPYSCPPLLSSLPYAVLLNSAQEQE